MTRTASLLAVLALALLAAAAPAEAKFRSCGQVNFTPNSDDLAGEIRAQGVTCRYARRFVRETEGSPGASVKGWTCKRTPVDDFMSLSHSKYRCTRGARTLRWKRY